VITPSQQQLLIQRFRSVASALTDAISVIDDLEADYNRTTPEMQTEAAKIVSPATVLQGRETIRAMRAGLVTAIRNYAGDLVWPVAE